MAELIVNPKISIGWRIALTENLCKQMNVSVGDKIYIVRRDDGEIVLRRELIVV